MLMRRGFTKKKYFVCLFLLYNFFQIVLLFILRKIYIATSYQTILFYTAISFLGIFLIYINYSCHVYRKKIFRNELWKVFCDVYVVCWSGVHATVVLAFQTYGVFYLTLTQITFVQIVNLFLGILLFWIIYIISGKVMTAISYGNSLIGIWGMVNYYLVRFRGTPFQITDIKAAKTALTVVENYDFVPSLFLILSLTDLFLWFILWKWAEGESGKMKKRYSRLNLINILGSIVILFVCVLLHVKDFGKIYAETQQFAQDCYFSSILAEFMGTTEEFPEGYSVENIEDIANGFYESKYDISDVHNSQKPHIIVIMNESFADLSILGDFETTQPVLEYWNSLKKNVIRGWANVSVLGGSTANSEYEFLTSDFVGAYTGSVPYNKYFKNSDTYPSIVSVLRQQGYKTTSFHPYLANGWNRTQVYRAMQFDNLFFLNDIDCGLETLRDYVSDEADYSYIIQYFEKHRNEGPQFFFNITMQNHGGYTFDDTLFPTTVQLTGKMQGNFPQAEQYLTLVRASDEALKRLIEYFSKYKEPVILVMFGDHQPYVEESFYEYVTNKPISSWSLEQKMNQYKTPFIIWHNYNSKSREIGDISLNYLAALIMEEAGLSLSPYQKYSLQQYNKMPVITSLGIKTANGTILGTD